MTLVNAASRGFKTNAMVLIGSGDKIDDIIYDFTNKLGLKEKIGDSIKMGFDKIAMEDVNNYSASIAAEDVKIPEQTAEQTSSLNKFYDEYAEKGSLSEKSYQDLAKQGLDKNLVDGYIEGQKALADNHTNAIHQTVGGKERYAELITWASKNLSEAEQNTFNNLVDGGTLDEAKFAVSGLMMKSGMNFNPNQPELFEGTSDITPNDAYESVSQVTDAMNDPRYETDPAYRKKVTDKLARSTVI